LKVYFSLGIITIAMTKTAITTLALAPWGSQKQTVISVVKPSPPGPLIQDKYNECSNGLHFTTVLAMAP